MNPSAIVSIQTGHALEPTDYRGPERRSRHAPLSRWLELALDHVGYGVMLVEHHHVLHVNRAARAELTESYPLQLLGRELRARRSQDVAPLHDALAAAAQRGLHRLLTLGEGDARVSIVVVPLGPQAPGEPGATLVMVGKRDMCEQLSVHWFARSHDLTDAETQVLEALCRGATASQIARGRRVKLSTVRSQIGAIRQKTDTDKIASLVRKMGMLPPLVGTLRCVG
jgi:DNA-binding CsgD family transcriptional regulator